MRYQAALKFLSLIGLALILTACKSSGGVTGTEPNANLDPAAATNAKVVPMIKGPRLPPAMSPTTHNPDPLHPAPHLP